MITPALLGGRLRRHPGRIVAQSIGVAVTVALLASLGAFLAQSKATMTRRSIANVAVDWQVQANNGASAGDLLTAVTAAPGIRRAVPVDFARTTGLRATTAGTEQVTGAGFVLGMPPEYRSVFPTAIRTLVGADRGVLVAQQTAANLHVTPGDSVTIGRAGLPPVRVRVDGVVDLPSADSLFQVVGAPVGAAASAPPDNVLIVPTTQWHTLFDPLARVSPDLVSFQVHAQIDHNLPNDPAAAYGAVQRRANNLEARLTGAGKVGDNLGAALGSARADALYAQVLFVFLGGPGAVLAALLTVTVAAAGNSRRRREQALLRTRGATVAVLMRVALAEAAFVGVVGSVLGLLLAALVGMLAFSSAGFGATRVAALMWVGGAVITGMVTAIAAIAVPAWSDARAATVSAARRRVDRYTQPRWARYGVDLQLVAAGAFIFWLTSRGGYKLVVAPEGVPSITVSYWAFVGPALLWIGGGLLAWRLAELLARRGRKLLANVNQVFAGPLAGAVAASMQRQRRLLARGVALVALTATFAMSTAVFNATYRQQSVVDAVLTNGADVTVTRPQSAPGDATLAAALGAISGVKRVEPIRHRFAYVGADLQDLYGVDPSTVVAAAKLQNAYFRGGTATAIMQQLARRPDGVVVSAETARDYQLRPGDLVNLRLRDASTGRYTAIPFRYIAIGAEFPTAPRDSFLIANSAYIATQTHDPSISTFLVDTGGRNRSAVASAIRTRLGPGATVTDLDHTRRIIASSLTAVDLRGLTQVELGFALALTAAATGLVLWLGFAERRRTSAIIHALGARPRQLASFVWSEAAFVLVVGAALGAVGGALMSDGLVKILTGVFDPPPSRLAIPWRYLGATATIAVVAVAIAVVLAVRDATRPHLSTLRTV